MGTAHFVLSSVHLFLIIVLLNAAITTLFQQTYSLLRTQNDYVTIRCYIFAINCHLARSERASARLISTQRFPFGYGY